ncbi:MAG TPA: hypothetical protein VNI53_04880 [Gammaproteobacteria bacterium]|nr:hypothetical protein [Gammaproteobacteria bacterium]
MSEVTRFEVWFAISASLLVVGVLLPIVQLHYYRHAEWSPVVWIAAMIVLFAGIIGFAYVGGLWDAPEAYTRAVGVPQVVRIDHWAFLPGDIGDPNYVRIDTDHGVYFLNGYATVPDTGTVYAIERRKFWGPDTQAFLCLNTYLTQCWPIVTTPW